MALAVAGLIVGPGVVLAHHQGQMQGQGTESQQGYGRMHHSQATIKEVQQKLKDEGQDPGAIDGKMGPKTHDALKQFQQSKNLPATGRLDHQTMSALNVSGGGTSGMSGTRGSQSGTESEKGTGAERQPGSGSEGTHGVPGESGGGTQGYRGGAGNQPQ